LIEHLLKLKYWESEKERNYRHWKVEAINFRSRIARLLKRNPSFKKYMQEIYPSIFQDTVKSWRVEFEIPLNSFVELETMMNDDYFG
jgi:hypothetical protein